MSIDATVRAVILNENGGGRLELTGPDRGQSVLTFDADSDFEEVTALNGCHIWGSSSSIMMGEVEIAKRIGYTQIKFCIDSFRGIEMKYAHSPVAQVT